jgi:Sec-independent protein translocase protein TatA
MFNLSFGEIFVIIILAILFIKPSDLPNIAHNVKKAFNKFLALKAEFMDEIQELNDDIRDLEEDLMANDKIQKEEMKPLNKNKGEKDGK